MPIYVEQPGAAPLAASGALLPVRLAGPQGAVDTQALVDSGSTLSSADRTLLESVGATQIGTVTVQVVVETVQLPLYGGAAILGPGGQSLSAGLRGIIGDSLAAPTQVLIGRDVLSAWDLVYDGPTGQWVLAGPLGSPLGSPVVTAPAATLAGAVVAAAALGAGAGLVVDWLVWTRRGRPRRV